MPRKSYDEDDDQDVDRLDEVGSRKKKKPVRKKSAGWGPLWLALILTGSIAVLGVIALVAFVLLAPVLEGPVAKRVRVYDEATALLSRVQDNSSAHAIHDPLVGVGQRLHAFELEDLARLQEGMKYLKENQQAIDDAIAKALANPQAARAQADKMAGERLPIEQAQARLVAQMQRVWAYPSGQETIRDFLKAWDKVPVQFGLFDANPNLPAGFPGLGGNPLAGVFAPPAAPPQGRLPQGLPLQPARPASKCNPTTWAQVRLGMSESDVVALIGPPTNVHEMQAGTRAYHYHGDGVLGVLMFQNGRLTVKNGQ